MIILRGKYNIAKVMIDSIDATTQSQIISFLNHPAFSGPPIVIMPDCLPDDTEVLTSSGFKRISDLSDTDPVANVAFPTKQVFFEPPKAIISRQLKKNEKVFSLTNEKLNICITSTENHRNAYIRDLGMVTQALPSETSICDYVWNGNGLITASGCGLSINEIRFVAWIVGDGNIKITHNPKSDNLRIRFGMKKRRKIVRVLELCTNLGITPKVLTSDKQTEIYINTEDSKRFITIVGMNKVYPLRFIETMTSIEAKALLDEAVRVDGDYEAFTSGRGVRYNSTRQKDIDILAALAVIHIGMCTIRKRKIVSNLTGKTITSRYLNVVSEEKLTNNKSGFGKRQLTKTVVTYSGKVVCLTCSSGFFIARQNGRIFVTGNCHAGKGVVVGFTMQLKDHVIPNVVGVDLGCGVYTYNIGKGAIKYKEFDEYIRENIPSAGSVRPFHKALVSGLGKPLVSQIEEVCSRIGEDFERTMCSAGTLGGGNHYIELNKDEDKDVWLSLHSGSRHFGLAVATFHQKKAKELMLKMFQGASAYFGLEFLPMDVGGQAYMRDMRVAQAFADRNRELMAQVLLGGFFVLDIKDVESIKSVHNYIGKDNIIRKGAISALEGEKVIIPLNMRDGAIIGVGKGASSWNYSAPHGAGRKYSRRKAKEKLSLEKFEQEMKDVWSSCVRKSTLDESPMAYKDASDILDNIDETVEVTDIMKPIYNFKAD